MGGSKKSGTFNNDGFGAGWLPDVNKLPGMPGSYGSAGAPQPSNSIPPEMARANLRQGIVANEKLDEIARNDLLKEFDAGTADPSGTATEVSKKFSTMLDPETPQGKELLARKARMTAILEQPGLTKQTTFLSGGGSYLGGNGGTR